MEREPRFEILIKDSKTSYKSKYHAKTKQSLMKFIKIYLKNIDKFER